MPCLPGGEFQPLASGDRRLALAGEGIGLTPAAAERGLVIVVEPLGGRDGVRLEDAVAEAPEGTRLILKPGRHRAGLKITRPIELIGDGPPGSVVLFAAGRHVVSWKAKGGRISGVMIEQTRKRRQYALVFEDKAHAVVENSILTGHGDAALGIGYGADPVIRCNIIAGSDSGGILIYQQGKGHILRNRIVGNGGPGVRFKQGSHPLIEENIIDRNRGSGVTAYDRGRGVIRGNLISDNGKWGVFAKERSTPRIEGNTVKRNRKGGVVIVLESRARIERNIISGNPKVGLGVSSHAVGTASDNRIIKNTVGVYVSKGGRLDGTGNELGAGNRTAVIIKDDAGEVTAELRVEAPVEAAPPPEPAPPPDQAH